ncbi:MAG: helix-turn-helix domain-containing protein, partial [Peptococcaceae bacterium]|nr:helix-turn-helix domain-containing protein [Peptococcaceae bacterium]
MKLSDKLIALRKNAGMSQEELAEKLDVSRQAISRWENDSAKPDADHLLQISKLFGVTADYLLNEAYESDDDLPKVKQQNHILHTNLTLIAIIAQVSFLNAAIKPFDSSGSMNSTELLIKFVPLLVCSIWMAYNLRYEKDAVQYKKNTKIELLYCMV